jgi:L-iditol 2-dehydrogenase
LDERYELDTGGKGLTVQTTSGTMKAVILAGNRKVDIVDRPVPRTSRDEVLVRVHASGLCRSDLSLYRGDPVVGGENLSRGVIPGHEPAGEVVELGADVDERLLGQRVAVYLGIGCGRCVWCKKGYPFTCPEWKCVGVDRDGGDAEYLAVPAANCLPLPPQMSYEDGVVLTDNIGTQYSTQSRLHVNANSTVLVCGLGPMGAAAVTVAKGLGATVVASDIVPSRRKFAGQLGADEAIDPAEPGAAEHVRSVFSGEGADVAIDCSGSQAGQNFALDCARRMGSVAFVGESRASTIHPSDQIIRKLLTVIGGWYFPIWQWDEILNFVTSKKLAITKAITTRCTLEEAAGAFAAFDDHQTNKIVFQPARRGNY